MKVITEYQYDGDIYSQDIQVDYSASTNPLDMPETARRVLRDCLEREVCSLYPNSRREGLRQALSRHRGMKDKWIICGNGATDSIFGLAAALRPIHGLVAAPALSEYEQASRSVGRRTNYHYLREDRGFALDAIGMCDYVRAAAERGEPYDVVLLCNPNNLTGIPVKRGEVKQLVDTCERLGTYLVVDKCFCDLLDNSELYSVIPDLARLMHLLILKAFTKLYAMAGLRLSYGLCSDSGLLERLQAVRQPWPVSGPTQCVGVAALGETDSTEYTRMALKGGREGLSTAPHGLGFRAHSSQANYLLFRDQEEDGILEKGRLYQELLGRRTLIRSRANYPGLDSSFYRICVKLRQDSEQLIQEVARVLKRRKPCPDMQSQS